ncbi:hypothetical protein [Brevundimonas sp.]|uniref:hypothetical protein n=1 Tax=Brevundimonas sp. TaxID=1871086 RepID=UPI00289FC049|nr:hypothetical protein [Brevundimonas sp.]
MTQATPERRRDHRSLMDRLGDSTEGASALILSVAALMTAWSSYQSSLWDGDQAAAYSQAESVRTTASRWEIQAGQAEGADVLLFTQWLDAHAKGQRGLEAFYEARFRPPYRVAHDAWVALRPLDNPDAPRTPFVMPEYRLEATREGAELEQRADALFQEGQKANRISDDFVRATVILASAMFSAGIVQVFRRRRVRLAVVALAALQCVWGIYNVVGLPPN